MLKISGASEMLRRKRRRRSTFRLQRQLPPRTIERDYLQALSAVLSSARYLVNEKIVPMLPRLQRLAGIGQRVDDYSDDLDRAMQEIRLQYLERMPPERLSELARNVESRTEDFNAEQLNAQLRPLIRVDIIGRDPMLGGMAKAFVQENVKLIQSIPHRYFDEIETGVLRNFRQGKRAEDAEQWIAERYDVSEERAALIARDQIGKLNGELNQVRQTRLGLTQYIWRTSRDERVRGDPNGKYPNADPSHYDREGKLFDWNDPPEDGHPGQPVQCRCTAEPFLDDILSEL